MQQIYENFAEIADKFDNLFVDAFGVFWNGKTFYDGSREILAEQVKKGKKVIVLSNTPELSVDAMQSYAQKGMTEGEHYTNFVTSGDAIHNALLNDSIDIKGNKIYILGAKNTKIFNDTKYQIVSNPAEADAFYTGIPQFTEEEVEEHSLYADNFYRSPQGLYDSTAIEPFIPELKKLYRLGLTAINANPDFRANEGDEYGDIHTVIRPGLIAETYRKMGGKVIEFGKPHKNIYEYAFNLLNFTPSFSTAMIGDTYRTDIKGAQNAGINGVWCIETGITAKELQEGKTLEEISGGNFENVYLIKALACK
ncbi:MAG: HAD hydrolase-like protein [Alphaproteobacteria bacterium]|nr:HAD hydrolase-like protein [Alphaproteobacteria bacterium]